MSSLSPSEHTDTLKLHLILPLPHIVSGNIAVRHDSHVLINITSPCLIVDEYVCC